MKAPLVSIIIINYNAQQWLEKCLASIAKNTYPNYEVIVVDNGSESFTLRARSVSDKSRSKKGSRQVRQFLHPKGEICRHPSGVPWRTCSNMKIIKLDRNYGPAYARNLGLEKARGKYLAFLDNDTEVDKNWLTNAVKILEKDPTIGALQCKLLLNKKRNRFDYAGDYLTQWGFLAQVVEADTKDTNQIPEGLEILAAKSAGMVIRTDTFKKAGVFDENYFIYLEETDLSWRVWLAGKRVVFTNKSKVYHEFGTTAFLDPKLGHKNVKYHGTKNYISTLVKNLELVNLLRMLPIHLALWLAISGILLLKGDLKGSFYVLAGISYNIYTLPALLKKRKRVQGARKNNDADIFPSIYKSVKLGYFTHKLIGRSERVGLAKGW